MEPILPGKYYHIYNRGNNREDLFRTTDNYSHFLYLYEKYIFPVADTFACVLLKNHFHLLVRIKEEDEIGYYNSEEDNIKEAAIRLLNIIIKHGWGAAYFGYKAQTAALTKIINEMRDFYMADVELIGAKTRFDLMVTRQNDFEELQKSSITRPPSNLPTLVETRPKIIDGLRKLMTMVDNHYSTNPTDVVLAGYVKAFNELITLTMTMARAAQTRDESKKKNDGSDKASAA